MTPDAPVVAQARSVRLCRALILALGLVWAVDSAPAQNMRAGSDIAGASQIAASSSEIRFDIPSQPLADALIVFGNAAGLEVFYDGSLAIGRRSVELRGTFTPMQGLQVLLRGTGYVPKTTEHPGTVTIVSVPRAAPPVAALSRYEPYFAVLQTRFSEALCESDEDMPGDEQIIFKVWLDPSGLVSRAEVLGSAGSSARRLAIASGMQGLRIGKAPPSGLPQPVTMVIYPPSVGEATGCPATSGRHAGN